METLKKKLSGEWNKPKPRNIKTNDIRTPRDYNVIHSVQEEINNNKEQIENSVQAKRLARKKEASKSKVSFLKSLFGKKKVMQVKAMKRREKRKNA